MNPNEKENVLISSQTIDGTQDIANTTLRFWFLGFSCILGIGSYFCYDNPSALEQPLIRVRNS